MTNCQKVSGINNAVTEDEIKLKGCASTGFTGEPTPCLLFALKWHTSWLTSLWPQLPASQLLPSEGPMWWHWNLGNPRWHSYHKTLHHVCQVPSLSKKTDSQALDTGMWSALGDHNSACHIQELQMFRKLCSNLTEEF